MRVQLSIGEARVLVNFSTPIPGQRRFTTVKLILSCVDGTVHEFTGEVRCSEKDQFERAIGRQLAWKRLLEIWRNLVDSPTSPLELYPTRADLTLLWRAVCPECYKKKE